MIIITDANGNLQAPTIPENIYQGSNKANSIVFLSPLAQSNTATIMFRLPSGLLTPEYLMTSYDDVPSQYKLNAWVRDIDSDITALYGTVTYQIKLTNANGTIVTSVAGTFNVLRGVAPLPSTTPSTTNWAEILSYLSQINSDIENGWLVSKGILPYDVNFAYPLNASVWNKANNTIYTSLVDDNLGNALTDTSKWGATSLVAMSDLNDYYTKGETDNLLNNKANINDVPTKTSDLTNDSGFITNTVNDLANYYKKSETYTQAEVNALIQNINAIQIRNVNNEAINATNATVQSVATQYIVDNYQRQPKQLDGLIITLTDQNNDKVLFVYSETSSLWINVGLNGVDLSNYYTKSETENYVDNKYVGSEYISVDDGEAGTLQEGKKVVRLDKTNVETGQASENSDKLITSGAVFNSLQNVDTQIDNISITKNTEEKIQTIGVIDQNTGNANKEWTGTKAEYDALPEKDPNTFYNITDDNGGVVESIGGATGDITLGTGLSIENNVLSASGGGGSKLYEHILYIYVDNADVWVRIINNSQTLISTNEQLSQFLYNNGFTSGNSGYPVNSTLRNKVGSSTGVGILTVIYSNTGTYSTFEGRIVDLNSVINDDNTITNTWTVKGVSAAASLPYSFTDNVREL